MDQTEIMQPKKMSTPEEQLDLFVAMVGDIPWRDDTDLPAVPHVSLAKNSPTRMEWRGPKGQEVVVTGDKETKIATIYDFDVILWAISQLNAAVDRGQRPNPAITFKPYDLLKAIYRDTGGKGYQELKAAIVRLQRTRIETTIRRENKKDRVEAFNLLTEYTIDERDGRPAGMQIVVPRWIFRAVVEQRHVLAINREYFRISSGLDRFLYRLARKSVGNGKEWIYSFQDLHSRAGETQEFKKFAFNLRQSIKRDALPDFSLREEEGGQGPNLRFLRRPIEILDARE